MSQIHDRFQTTIAGSLPKPAWLAEPNKLWPAWRASGAELERAKRDATLLWLKEQEDVGIDIVTEGEQSRQHFVHGFLEFVDVIQFDEPAFNVYLDDVKRWGIDALHRAIEGLKCTTCVHICYGYGIQANIDWKRTLGGEWRQYAEIFPALAKSRIKQVSLECIHSKVPIELLKLLKGKDVLVGVIDVATDRIESAEEVSDVIEKALQYVPAKHLFPCTNCGMAPMDREVALKKLRALAAGAALARKKLGNRGQSPISGGKRGLSLFSTRRRRRRGSTRTSSRAGRSRPRAAASPRRAARRK